MSWLLVVCIPGLLMLATFGLSRLEAMLDTSKETYTAADVKAFLDKVKAAWSQPAESTSSTLPHRSAPRFEEPRALAAPSPMRDNPLGAFGEPELPNLAHPRYGGNPQFRETRHANRV
ncbi:hypothetical protein BOO86_09910 [Mycobacterium sp. CBMA 234]|nr:hypothetical protein [Mycolicibacterium sp. CBMA 234]